LNPYLPQFDTYYRFKNPIAQCTGPVQDQNQKHFVKECHTRFPDANNGVNVIYDPNDSVIYLNPTTRQFQTQLGTNGTMNPPTDDGCVLQP